MAGSTRRKMNWKTLATNIASSAIRIAVLVLVVVAIYKFTQYAYEFGYRIFAEEPMTEGNGITVTITYSPDDSIKDLGQKLYDQGLIRDVNLFYFQEKFSNFHDMLQPGTYELNTSMTVEEMLGVIAEGPDEVFVPLDEIYGDDGQSESTEDYEGETSEQADVETSDLLVDDTGDGEE